MERVDLGNSQSPRKIQGAAGNNPEEGRRSDGAKKSGEAAKGATGGGRERGADGKSNYIGGAFGQMRRKLTRDSKKSKLEEEEEQKER